MISRDEAYRKILNTKNQTKEEARETLRRMYRKELKNSGAEFIMITDDEIDAVDYTQVHAFFNKLIRQWRAYKGRVMLVVDGYDHMTEELYEIPQVKSYFYNLFKEYPHYLYFLSELTESFQLCLIFLAGGIDKDASPSQTFMERLESFDGDYDAFDEEMDKLRMDVHVEIKGDTYENLAMTLTEWFLERHAVGEAYALLNKIKEYTEK